ncbi:MAG: Na/Pi symporter, partial [Gemmatimonadota bacterium]|nr:Na/Pi symporter [Gemmatimonadota bacterium]
MTGENSSFSKLQILRNIILFVIFLYLFLLSIQLMGSAFKFFGKGFAENLLKTTSSPLAGLFIGLLATSLMQSSSTTTSIVVGLVSAGALPLHNAIPIVMGANMGTTVTNTIVSMGHIGRREDFRRAFSASVVHDVFNFFAVLIFFPLQYYTNYLEKASVFLTGLFGEAGGLAFASPLKLITAP